jgi:hypothetical protein
MEVIGNIVSDKLIHFDPKIKVVSSINEIITGLPTLIIDLETARNIFPDDFNILNKEIKSNYFWTYTLKEKRVDYEIDIEVFIQYCYNKIISDIEYVFIDPIQFKLKTLKKVLKKIYSTNNLISFIYKDFIYIYCDKIIFGIDLHLCEFFFDIRKSKIINKVKVICDNNLLGENDLKLYKDYLSRIDSIKYIPYLHYISNT